jgi:predicted P-loop ATPase
MQMRNGAAVPNPNSPANHRYLFSTLLGYSFSRNVRRDVVFASKDGKPPELLSDALLAQLRTAARSHALSPDAVFDTVVTMASEQEFDPLLDALARVKWDGRSRFDELFDSMTIDPDADERARETYKLYLRRWTIGIIAKILSPGSENNVLVLHGQQAAGKSRWLKRFSELWPDGFGEGHVSPDDKDHELRHIDNFLWHVAEFDSTTSRREVGALKDYFTKDTVSVRRPYSRLPIIGRSICSFCASVNSADFLHDTTGNRRYLVIPVVALNPDHKIDMSQLLAEAKVLLESGERQWFTPEEIVRVNELNAQFVAKEEWVEVLQGVLRPGEHRATMRNILNRAGLHDVVLSKHMRSTFRTIAKNCGVKEKLYARGVSYFLVDWDGLKVDASKRFEDEGAD